MKVGTSWSDLTEEQKQNAVTLYKKGMNFNEINRVLGIPNASTNSISKGIYAMIKDYSKEQHTIDREKYLMEGINQSKVNGEKIEDIIEKYCMSKIEKSHFRRFLCGKESSGKESSGNTPRLTILEKKAQREKEEQEKQKRRKRATEQKKRILENLDGEIKPPTADNTEKIKNWLKKIGIPAGEIEEAILIFPNVLQIHKRLCTIRDIMNNLFFDKKEESSQKALLDEIKCLKNNEPDNIGMIIVKLGSYLENNISKMSLDTLNQLQSTMVLVENIIVQETDRNEAESFGERIKVSKRSTILSDFFYKKIMKPIEEAKSSKQPESKGLLKIKT